MKGPLVNLAERLPPHVRRVAERDTPIPTIAQRAQALQQQQPLLVRADIGQVVGVDDELEVVYGPPVGLEPLREAVAELYRRSFDLDAAGWSIGARNVAITSGAAEALALAFACFAADGDVGLPRGHWENYANGVDMARGRAHVVDYFDVDGRFDATALAAQIRQLGLAALVANFPCNPTGAVLDAGETEALARVAIDTGVVLIADEVYARLRFDGVAPQSLLRYAPDNALSIGSASKEYLLPGGRVGYLVSAHVDLVDRVFRRLIRANTASPNVLAQRRLVALIDKDLGDMRAGRPPGLIARVTAAMKERRDALLAVLSRHGMPPHGRPPEGTIFLVAKLPPWWPGSDDAAFAEAGLAHGCLSCIPGSAFGLPGTVRLSFGAMAPADIARLDDRLAALRSAVAAGNPATIETGGAR
jgi:aspartate aminotransferase